MLPCRPKTPLELEGKLQHPPAHRGSAVECVAHFWQDLLLIDGVEWCEKGWSCHGNWRNREKKEKRCFALGTTLDVRFSVFEPILSATVGHSR